MTSIFCCEWEQPNVEIASKLSSPKEIAAKENIVWACKGILAVFTALLATSSVLVAFEFTSQRIFPDGFSEGGPIGQSMAAMVMRIISR